MENKRWIHKIVKRENCYRRLAGLILSIVLVLTAPATTVFAAPEWPSDTGVQSEAGIVVDMDSGAVLFGQNIRVHEAPASITKLLTALIVIENGGLDEMVTFTPESMEVESASGNKLSLAEGDTLTVEDCLYVMLLQSSNQSANALAEHVAGSRSAFVERMNEKARELGCENSNFANPSGLNDDNQYTSAYDMWLISRAAFSNATLLKISSTKSHKIPPTQNNPDGVTFSMEHKLIMTTDTNDENYFPYAVAGKTGFTSIAGQTLVTYARKDDRNLICVTLKSMHTTHYQDSIALLDFGFNRFKNWKIADNEELPAAGEDSVDLGNGVYARSDLSFEPNAVITLPNDAVFTDAQKTLETELPADAPKGAVARLAYTYNERKIGSAYILSAKKAAEGENGIAGTEAGTGESGESPAAPEESGEPEKTKKLPSIHFPEVAGRIILPIGILALLAAGAVLFLRRKRAEERRLQEERKQRRRKRLEEMGCSEEEFNRMLEERYNKNQRR